MRHPVGITSPSKIDEKKVYDLNFIYNDDWYHACFAVGLELCRKSEN